MRTLIALLIVCLFTSKITAQSIESEVLVDTVVQVSDDKYKVVTNYFFDNWFFGAAAGTSMFFGDHDKQMKFMERQSLVYEVYFGKWFSPGIGVRAGANAGTFKGLTQNGAHSTGEQYDGKSWEGYWLYNSEQKYYHIKGDAMFNFTNIFGGYRERFYNVIPYVGLGWMVSYERPKAREVSASIGVLNTFRLSKSFDLTLDFRGSSVNDRFDGETGQRKEEGLLTGQIGLKYSFRKRGWDKPESKTITIRSDDSKLKELIDKLNDELDLLRKQLADAKGDVVTEVVVEKERSVLAAPILVTFPIDTWIVRNEARVNLGFFADIIKQGDPNIVYNITGYADKGTGSVKRNEKLSRERANVIYDVLVNEFGVSPSQLKKDHKGGVDDMYYNDPRCSRAVIVKAD